MEGLPPTVWRNIVQFVDLRSVLTLRLVSRRFCQILEDPVLESYWGDLVKTHDLSRLRAMSERPSCHFLMLFGLNSGRWRRRDFESTASYSLPPDLQENCRVAVIDAHDSVDKVAGGSLGLMRIERERNFLADPKLRVHFPILLEERPKRNRQLHIFWPTWPHPETAWNGYTTMYSFGAVLAALPPAASAPLENPYSGSQPEAAWAVPVGNDPQGYRHILLVNWSSVVMSGPPMAAHCRLSLHEIHPVQPAEWQERKQLPRPMCLFCFSLARPESIKPQQLVVTALDGLWISAESLCIAVVGTSEGDILISNGRTTTEFETTVAKTARHIGQNRGRVKQLRLSVHDEGMLSVFAEWEPAQYCAVYQCPLRDVLKGTSESWKTRFEGGYDHRVLPVANFVYCHIMQQLAILTTTGPIVVVDLKQEIAVAEHAVIGPLTLSLGGSFEETRWTLQPFPSWLVEYRVNHRPANLVPIPLLGFWVIAVDSFLRVLTFRDGTFKLITVLTGHHNKIYQGKYDGAYRFVSIDRTETLFVWDLRRRLKVCQISLLDPTGMSDLKRDHSMVSLRTNSSLTKDLISLSPAATSIQLSPPASSLPLPLPLPDPVMQCPDLAQPAAFPPLPNTATPVDHAGPKYRGWGKGARAAIELNREAGDLLVEGAEGELAPSIEEFDWMGSKNRRRLTCLEVATAEMARRLGLSPHELERYHELLIQESGAEDKLPAFVVNEVEQMPGSATSEQRADEQPDMSSYSPDRSMSERQLIRRPSMKPLVTLMAQKIHGLPCPPHLVVKPFTADESLAGARRLEEAEADLQLGSRAEWGSRGERRQKQRLLVRAESERQALDPMTPSSLLRRVKADKAVTNITFSERHLGVFFQSLGTWEIWRI